MLFLGLHTQCGAGCEEEEEKEEGEEGRDMCSEEEVCTQDVCITMGSLVHTCAKKPGPAETPKEAGEYYVRD